ncbi:MAG: FecR domain-containing protein [Burkholderiales bacterium]|nr:FecR domain-containing protein [Burkholderiales bacterium]
MSAPQRSPKRCALAVLAAAGLLACGASFGAGAAADPAWVYSAEPGDTLIGLGQRLLADPSSWREVARESSLRNPNRIAVGTSLRIPLRLLRSEPAPASLLSATGDVHAGAKALHAGDPLAEGSVVETGADGQATVKLVDGTVLRLRSAGRLDLSESRRLRELDATRSGVKLEQGRVEIKAAPAHAGLPGFEIRTPQGVLGVRGTEFRVETEGARGVTRGEVLGGVVAFDGEAAGSPGQRVGAGHGTVISAAGTVAPAVALLAPPDTRSLPSLEDRILVRFALTPVEGAVAYRGQVARDASFDQLVAEVSSASPELRIAGLPDGSYFLRVSAVDAAGLQGEDAIHRFTLKARPEAPMPSAPAPRAVLFGDRVELAWAGNDQARSYRLQLAGRAGFDAPLKDLSGLDGQRVSLEGLAPGTYRWRLASTAAGDDKGPWGAERSFELRPLPKNPPPPVVGDRAVDFSWEGRPGQTFEFQVARNERFAPTVFERVLDQPKIELPLPGVGRFYVRLRARDPDGFVGPYTAAQHFDVPNCVRSSGGGCVHHDGAPLILSP